jgi:nucleoside 2-deoxyribosyltransferase
MRIYLICPVRNATRTFESYVAELEAQGHTVHFPPRDVAQDCPTGQTICEKHRAAMIEADEVHVVWDVESKGSHFDLGMAYALHKPIVAVQALHADDPGKSYWKAVVSPGR